MTFFVFIVIFVQLNRRRRHFHLIKVPRHHHHRCLRRVSFQASAAPSDRQLQFKIGRHCSCSSHPRCVQPCRRIRDAARESIEGHRHVISHRRFVSHRCASRPRPSSQVEVQVLVGLTCFTSSCTRHHADHLHSSLHAYYSRKVLLLYLLAIFILLCDTGFLSFPFV